MDKWKPDHLRAMMLGGNQRAREFFKSHGWDNSSSQDFEAKYQSRAAKLYHKALYKEVATKTGKQALGSPKAFDDVKVPSFSQEPASPEQATYSPESAVAAAPEVLQPKRTISPSTAPPTGDLGGLELLMGGASVSASAMPPSSAAAVVRPKKTGLGAKRVTTAVPATAAASKDDDLDLEKARLEIEKQKEAAKASVDAAVPVSRYGGAPKAGDTGDDFFSMMTTAPSKSVASSSSSSYSRPTSDYSAPVPSGTAQERFKNAKGISSDQFFGRDKVDEPDGVKQAQLSRFQNASAISSDAYFGKEQQYSGSGGGGSSSASYNTGGQAADFFSELSRQVKSDVATLAQQAKESLAKYSRG